MPHINDAVWSRGQWGTLSGNGIYIIYHKLSSADMSFSSVPSVRDMHVYRYEDVVPVFHHNSGIVHKLMP